VDEKITILIEILGIWGCFCIKKIYCENLNSLSVHSWT